MSMQAAWQRAARPPVLALDKVSIAYEGNEGRRRVVHEVSFTIEPGEVVALVGESGSGKTTTAQAPRCSWRYWALRWRCCWR